MEQQQAIWEGWRDGESFRQVGDRVDQPAHVVQYFLRGHGGIKPNLPRRNRRHLTHQEREEISRGVAKGLSIRRISAALGRSHSSISRELARNGGRVDYRATAADQAARVRMKRPKPSRLKQRPALLQVVKAKLILGWSNENTNRMLRQYLTKGSDLRRFTAKDLDDIANLTNDRPRQILKWATSNDLYQTHLTTNQPEILSESQVVR